MSTLFGDQLQDCKEGQQRFFAEFTWDGNSDKDAEDRFKKWDTDLFVVGHPPKPRWETITVDNTHAYYLVGTRTFWIISCAKDQDEVRLFCDYITKDSLIKCSYYQCLKPGEPGAPA